LRNGKIDYKQIGRILAHIKEKQGIKCDISLDIITWQFLARKWFSNFLTILELWLIFLLSFLHNISEEKKWSSD
jgi:hypothetical protein